MTRQVKRGRARSIGLVLVGALVLTAAAPALQRGEQDRERRSDEEYVELIEMLEHGLVALERLGRHGEHEALMRIADQLRDERREAARKRGERRPRDGDGQRRERARDAERHQIEILHIAHAVLREAARGDASEVLGRAIRAREVALEGRRDPEAAEIRKGAPSLEAVVESLQVAAEVYQDEGRPERAQAVAELAESYMGQSRRQRQRRAGDRARGEGERQGTDRERELRQRAVKALRYAEEAFREAGRQDAGDLTKHAYRATEMQLEGRRDAEAEHFIRQAPELGATVELLANASGLYAEWGYEERAHYLAQIAEQLRGIRQRRGEQARATRGTGGSLEETFERLVRRLQQMEREIEELQAEIERLGRGRR